MPIASLDLRIEPWEVGELLNVIARRVHVALSVVCAHEEAPGAARRVEHRVRLATDAKRISQVHDIIACEMLSVTVPFLRSNELLKDAPHDV